MVRYAVFCNRLSERDGLPAYYRLVNTKKDGNHIESGNVTVLGGRGYRLPTEAKWEYACRAGTTTAFHFGNNGREANVDGNKPYGTPTKGPHLGQTRNVGSYGANAFGLHDMHGNVWEWCWDWYNENYYAGSLEDDPMGPVSGTSRVLRGGSWLTDAWFSRSALRFRWAPGDRYSNFSFRVARSQ